MSKKRPEIDSKGAISAALKGHIRTAVAHTKAAFDEYGISNVFFAWNGGKDSTVLLHIIRAAIGKNDLSELNTIFWERDDSFDEMTKFSDATAAEYGFSMMRLQGDYRKGLQDLVDKKGMKAVLMGTRAGDPDGGDGKYRALSTDDYPPFMRVFPLIDWSYGDVWEFLRYFEVPVCDLYSVGYSSIGVKSDTAPNPRLLRADGSYAPAWELVHYEEERCGRSNECPAAEDGWKTSIREEFDRRRAAQVQHDDRFPLVHDTTRSDEAVAMVDVILSGRLTMAASDMVANFEREFAKYVGAPYAVMVNSGSSANLLAMAVLASPLRSQHLKKGDEMGCTPVFVDVDPLTFNMDVEDMRRRITPKTKGVVAVHVLGNSTNMTSFLEVVREHNLLLLEDTCESLGSVVPQGMLGTIGDFGSFSFFFSHHMTTGEGGMVTCKTREDQDLLHSMRAHGWTRTHSRKAQYEALSPDVDPQFLFINVGYNLRPMALQAAMGLVQIRRLAQMNINRRFNYFQLRHKLYSHPAYSGQLVCMVTPEEAQGESAGEYFPVWFGCPFLVAEKYQDRLTELKAYLSSKYVDNRPVISGNFLRQPAIKVLDGNHPPPAELKGADTIHWRGLFLGLDGIRMSDDALSQLVEILMSFSW